MSDSWQAGDRAQVIERADLRGRNGHLACGGRFLRPGATYQVRAILQRDGDQLLDIGVRSGPKLAQRFRKVPPQRTSMVADRRAPVDREVFA
ncbi:MAG: hypothetical protein ABIQ81_00150 [Novosphingobium sp.]